MLNGEEIAVKRLHSMQGLDDKDFRNELRKLNKIRHKNIIRLIGYCHDTHKKCMEYEGELVLASIQERLLCFEYMQGGSLDKHIGGNYIMTNSLVYVLLLVCMTKMNGSEECAHFLYLFRFYCQMNLAYLIGPHVIKSFKGHARD